MIRFFLILSIVIICGCSASKNKKLPIIKIDKEHDQLNNAKMETEPVFYSISKNSKGFILYLKNDYKFSPSKSTKATQVNKIFLSCDYYFTHEIKYLNSKSEYKVLFTDFKNKDGKNPLLHKGASVMIRIGNEEYSKNKGKMDFFAFWLGEIKID